MPEHQDPPPRSGVRGAAGNRQAAAGALEGVDVDGDGGEEVVAELLEERVLSRLLVRRLVGGLRGQLALHAVLPQLGDGQERPHEHGPQDAQHVLPGHPGLLGEALLAVEAPERRLVHGQKLLVAGDDLDDRVHVAQPLRGVAPRVPEVHARADEESVDQRLVVVVRALSVQARTLLLQVGRRERMPHGDLLEEAGELLPLEAPLRGEAHARVPLEELGQGHLVDLLELLGQALGPLEVADPPRGHAHGLPLRELRLLLQQELDGALQPTLGGVVVRDRHAALLALPPELLHGQVLPDQRVPQALHQGLALHPGVEAHAQPLVLRPQRQPAHALQAVQLSQHLLRRLRAPEALNGDAAHLEAVRPQGGEEPRAELEGELVLPLCVAVRHDAARAALPAQLVQGEPVPDERLLQPGGHGLRLGVGGQLPLLAQGGELVARRSLQSPDLSQDIPRHLHAREPSNGNA
mmetsp:Transcript_92509/g.245718  ORF Transcript_92509/g.245718 Transcript_92509/m.245718 type:complete len:465 (-) Transcript_92509:171-1565(-)